MSKDDFEKIRDVELTGCRPEHSIVRDMFLFACYTGTSYVDVVAITPDNLSKDDQGAPWLKYRRGKNGQLCRVKLLPEAVALIEKYKDETTLCKSHGQEPEGQHEYSKEQDGVIEINLSYTSHNRL